MFQGFSKKTGEFLWELAFNNERPWFLAHKDEFEENVNAPFKELAGECFALMEQRYPALDCRVHVSRIYRDARRLFGRGPYKDHLWFSIKASQVLLEGPMFWFEVGAADYSYGMGFYSATPAQMEAFRRSIDANPERFRRIAEGVKRHGYKLDGEEYKRPKKLRGDALIDGWYNRKRIGLEKSFDLGGDAFSQKLPEILVSAYAELMPMYEYFMEIYRACPETGRPAPRGTGNAAE